jgi:hypothetical protein
VARLVVDAANDVHGYAHVRRASMDSVRAASSPRLAELTGAAPGTPARLPVAG